MSTDLVEQSGRFQAPIQSDTTARLIAVPLLASLPVGELRRRVS